jgi:hypothetical protein
VQFSLQLSEKEQIDRAKVVLPFEHQGMEPGMRVGVTCMCMSCDCVYNVFKVCVQNSFSYVYTYTCTPTRVRAHGYVCLYMCMCVHSFYKMKCYLTLKRSKGRVFTI